MSENCRKCAGRLVAAKLQTLTELARLARFERATAWFVARYSIQLSYRRVEGAYYRDEVVIRQGVRSGNFGLYMDMPRLSLASLASSSRKSGWAILIRSRARSAMDRPRSSAMPYSVTT